MTTNIKYILLFDENTPQINDTKDTVYFNNTPINNDTNIYHRRQSVMHQLIY